MVDQALLPSCCPVTQDHFMGKENSHFVNPLLAVDRLFNSITANAFSILSQRYYSEVTVSL